MEIMYYMPLFLTKKAVETQDEALLDFCDLFKIVNINASVIDRTGTIPTPFKVRNMYPLPEAREPEQSFGTACIDRALDILAEGKSVHLLYSGGIDSTCVVLAFWLACKTTGAWDQVVVSATPPSVAENPAFWERYIRPFFRLESSLHTLQQCNLEERYVQGENADQMFGSDLVFKHPWMLTTAYGPDSLHTFLSSLSLRASSQRKFMHYLQQIMLKCPLPVKTMADFMWWVNFTCKWQSVSLRTLSFTGLFAGGRGVALDELKNFETFFNTETFQQLAMSERIAKWGAVPSMYNYKQAARDFIRHRAEGQEAYCDEKIKVGSLYQLITQTTYNASAFGIDTDGLVRGTNTLG